MSQRTIEDRLRRDYSDLLPEIERVASRLDSEIRSHTLAILNNLKSHEKLIVKSRIKDCESAIGSARRRGNKGRGEGKVFDSERPDDYSLSTLPDLAGVRVLAFPSGRVQEVDDALKPHFGGWRNDPIEDTFGLTLAYKYDGYIESSQKVRAECQIVPMLLGLFWDVEHSAMYKFESVANAKNMQKRRAIVETALSDFEAGISSSLSLIPETPQKP